MAESDNDGAGILIAIATAAAVTLTSCAITTCWRVYVDEKVGNNKKSSRRKK